MTARPYTAGLLFALTTALAFSLTSCQHFQNPHTKLSSNDPSDELPDADYTPRALSVTVDPGKYKNDAATPFATPTNSAFKLDDDVRSEGEQDRYFLTVYGFQGLGPLNLPRRTHSWALFIHTIGGLTDGAIHTITISWNAADGDIGLFQAVEPGRNYSMEESFGLAAQLGSAIRRSPIVEVSKDLFYLAVQQWRKLEAGQVTGRVAYKMFDDFTGRTNVVNNLPGYLNCLHALTDILAVVDGGLQVTGKARGWEASDYAFDILTRERWRINSGVSVENTLGMRLGL